ncbi:hypothetical protein [Streptomyces sp. NPDC000410]|uniref:hypothetical protein n=1 Tax=Streptomyces sp. NPDC000410 TaxID=3154254 RepID=UPI0033337D64
MAISEKEQRLQFEARAALLTSIKECAEATLEASTLRSLAEAYALVVGGSTGEAAPGTRV